MTRHSPHRPTGRVFYATDEVTVTDQWLIFGKRRLPIQELDDPRIVAPRQSQLPLAVAVAAILFPLVSAFSGVRGAGWTAVALLTGCALTAAALLRRRQSPLFQLVATYQRVPVLAYWSSDARVFNQVTRAVMRAQDAHRTSVRLAATSSDSAQPAWN